MEHANLLKTIYYGTRGNAIQSLFYFNKYFESVKNNINPGDFMKLILLILHKKHYKIAKGIMEIVYNMLENRRSRGKGIDAKGLPGHSVLFFKPLIDYFNANSSDAADILDRQPKEMRVTYQEMIHCINTGDKFYKEPSDGYKFSIARGSFIK